MIKRIVEMSLALGVMMLTSGWCMAQPSTTKLVVAGEVFVTPYANRQTFVGSVQPLRQTVIGSAVEGRVRAVHVDRGTFVTGPRQSEADVREPGQVLVEVETDALKIEIDAAKIHLQLAEQAVEELTVTLPLEIELAEARVAEMNARLKFSQNEFNRLEKISATAISPAELEQARSQFMTDMQMQIQAEGTLKGLRGTRELKLMQAQSRVAAAQQEIVRLEDQFQKHQIRAFFDGYVVNKATEVGAWLTRGQPVVEVVELSSVEFAFSVPQEFIGDLQETLNDDSLAGQIEVEVEGFRESLLGRLTGIIPQVDTRTRMISVIARVSNPRVGNQPILKPGMLGKATMIVGVPRDLMVISTDAIVLGGPEPVVFKIVAGEKGTSVVSVPVKLGSRIGSWVEVSADLKAGDQVVVQGNERLRNNDAVVITRTTTAKPQLPTFSATTPSN